MIMMCERARPLHPQLDPTAVGFFMQNPLIETEDTLVHLLQHHDGLPQRHLLQELARAESLVKQGNDLFARDPNVPRAQEGVAGLRHALAAADFAHRAVSEAESGGYDGSPTSTAGRTTTSQLLHARLLEWSPGRGLISGR